MSFLVVVVLLLVECCSFSFQTIGSAPCIANSHTHQQIICSLPAGFGTGLSVTVLISGQTGTLASAFGYDSPVLQSVQPVYGPTVGGNLIQLFGNSFGTATGTILVGTFSCIVSAADSETSWTHDLIVCRMGQGQGSGLAITVRSADSRSASGSYSYSYLTPSITGLSASLYTGGGDRLLTIYGVCVPFFAFDRFNYVVLSSFRCQLWYDCDSQGWWIDLHLVEPDPCSICLFRSHWRRLR
jgi:hypothetical protein